MTWAVVGSGGSVEGTSPKNFSIAVRENRQADLQSSIEFIFHVQLHDHQGRKTSIRPLSVKSETEF